MGRNVFVFNDFSDVITILAEGTQIDFTINEKILYSNQKYFSKLPNNLNHYLIEEKKKARKKPFLK